MAMRNLYILFVLAALIVGYGRLTYSAPVTPSVPVAPSENSKICLASVDDLHKKADRLAKSYPELVQLHDIGNSWQKDNTKAAEGYDIQALQLGRLPTEDMPKLVILAGVDGHDRYTPQLALSFAEDLLSQYESDADARYLLEQHQVHLIFLGNPDGHHITDSFIENSINTTHWSKNDNRSMSCNMEGKREYEGGDILRHGVNLDFNFDYKWRPYWASGYFYRSYYYKDKPVPSQPCHPTYGGSEAASEPETRAIQTYLDKVLGKQNAEVLREMKNLFLQISPSKYNHILYPIYDPDAQDEDQIVWFSQLGSRLGSFNKNVAVIQPSHGYFGSAYGYAWGKNQTPSFYLKLRINKKTCQGFKEDVLKPGIPLLREAMRLAERPFQASLVGVISEITDENDQLTVRINPVKKRALPARHISSVSGITVYVDQLPDTPYVESFELALIETDSNLRQTFVMEPETEALLSGSEHTLYLRAHNRNGFGAVKAINWPLTQSPPDCCSDSTPDDVPAPQ